MAARIIDGVAVARVLKSEIAVRAATLKAHGITAGLGVIIVGDNAASHVYVRNKIKAAEALGLHSELVALPATVTQAELMAAIVRLNAAPEIHGFLVQMPLPRQVDSRRVLLSVVYAITALPEPSTFVLGGLGLLGLLAVARRRKFAGIPPL